MSDWEPTGAGEPAEELALDDLDVLDDLTHPLRSAVFRRLKQPHSAAELASALGVPVTRLYHHLNRLEQNGVIRVVATRRSGAATERRYQVVARSLQLSEDILDRYEPADVARTMGALFDFAKLRLQREIEVGGLRDRSPEHDALLALNELNLGAADRDRLLARLREVIDEFSPLDREAADASRVSVFIAAHIVSD